MITFKREQLHEFESADFEKHCAKHWTETGHDLDEIELALDWEQYHIAEDSGWLHCFIARNDNDIIGYIITFVGPGLHHKNQTFAINDVYYVAPEYRNNGVGGRFIRSFIHEMKDLGVKKLVIGTKLKNDHSKMLEAFGFKPEDMLYTKILN